MVEDTETKNPQLPAEFQSIGRGLREGGFKKGEITVMFAGRSTGKTQFMNDHLRALRTDDPVLVHNFDAPKENVIESVERLITKHIEN